MTISPAPALMPLQLQRPSPAEQTVTALVEYNAKAGDRAAAIGWAKALHRFDLAARYYFDAFSTSIEIASV
jgi:hypothetical protein